VGLSNKPLYNDFCGIVPVLARSDIKANMVRDKKLGKRKMRDLPLKIFKHKKEILDHMNKAPEEIKAYKKFICPYCYLKAKYSRVHANQNDEWTWDLKRLASGETQLGWDPNKNLHSSVMLVHVVDHQLKYK
jgi:hypothetical protein